MLALMESVLQLLLISILLSTCFLVSSYEEDRCCVFTFISHSLLNNSSSIHSGLQWRNRGVILYPPGKQRLNSSLFFFFTLRNTSQIHLIFFYVDGYSFLSEHNLNAYNRISDLSPSSSFIVPLKRFLLKIYQVTFLLKNL